MNHKEITKISLRIVAFISNNLFYTLCFFWWRRKLAVLAQQNSMKQVFAVLSSLGGGE
jgi:hypothetical protein